MKKVLLGLVALVAVLSVAAPVMAAGEMKIGLGYFRPEAPIGARVWVNPKIAIDFGFGFESKEYGQGDKSETKTSFSIDAGVPFVLAGDETTKFFLRPGILYLSDPNYDIAGEEWVTASTIGISANLGVEHFFSKWFSLEASHGFVFATYDPGTEGSDSSTTIYSEALGISSIGFHFYFLK